jgi:hypothetical protein
VTAVAEADTAGRTWAVPVGTAEFVDRLADGLTALKSYVSSEPFQRMLDEARPLDREGRDLFVRRVLLDPTELDKRGAAPPEGITIQRSEFGDRRPTWFCVNKFLPEGTLWKRVTLTFDHGATHGIPCN